MLSRLQSPRSSKSPPFAEVRLTPVVSVHRIGIEIVVEGHAVHVVLHDDLPHAVRDELPHLGETGVEVQPPVRVGHGPFGVLLRRVSRGKGGDVRAEQGRPQRIDPCEYADVPRPRRLDQIAEGIEGQSPRGGKGLRDGEEVAVIERVPGGTDLKEDRVQPVFLHDGEDFVKLRPQLVRREVGPRGIIQIPDGGDPDAAQLGIRIDQVSGFDTRRGGRFGGIGGHGELLSAAGGKKDRDQTEKRKERGKGGK